jgi:hypothetical protein
MEFLISLHIDNQLSDQELKELSQHFEECQQCRQTYKDLLNIKTVLSGEKNIEISSNFENNVMRKIKNSNINNKNIIYPNFKKRIIVLAASFLFIVISSVALFTTSSVEKKDSNYDFSWYYEINQDNSEKSNNTVESFMLNF